MTIFDARFQYYLYSSILVIVLVITLICVCVKAALLSSHTATLTASLAGQKNTSQRLSQWQSEYKEMLQDWGELAWNQASSPSLGATKLALMHKMSVAEQMHMLDQTIESYHLSNISLRRDEASIDLRYQARPEQWLAFTRSLWRQGWHIYAERIQVDTKVGQLKVSIEMHSWLRQ